MNINELIKSKQYVAASNACREIINEGKLNDDAVAVLTGFIYLGIIAFQQGRYAESKKIFDQNYDLILTQCTTYWPGNELIGCYMFYDMTDKALGYSLAYLQNNPSDDKALHIHARIYLKIGDYQTARIWLDRAIKANPENAVYYYTLGLTMLHLKENTEALHAFEKAYEGNNDSSVSEIFKMLFVRHGSCDWQNCTDCCCKKVVLKGVDGKPINQQESFNRLQENDTRNNCWIKQAEDKNGTWIFGCKNLGTNNFCHDHANRPDICRDYPSSILVLKKACSYSFKLVNSPPAFTSLKSLLLVLDVLDGYGCQMDKIRLMELNPELLSNKIL